METGTGTDGLTIVGADVEPGTVLPGTVVTDVVGGLDDVGVTVVEAVTSLVHALTSSATALTRDSHRGEISIRGRLVIAPMTACQRR